MSRSFTEEQRIETGARLRAWTARQSPEWRHERAVKAARAMHAAGKTNTGPATAAALARFPTREALVAHMAHLSERRWGR